MAVKSFITLAAVLKTLRIRLRQMGQFSCKLVSFLLSVTNTQAY